MAIHLIRGHEPMTIEHAVLTIWGMPGAGKTSLAFTADQPICIDFDKGVHRSANRKDAIQLDEWADLDGITKEMLAGHKTIIIDTIGRGLDSLSLALIEENPKNGRGGGALSLQGYGELKARMKAQLNLWRSYGMDVVLVAHDKEDKRGDDQFWRPDIQGGSFQEVFKVSDAVAFLYIGKGGARVLDWQPNEAFVAKNPASLEAVTLPPFVPEEGNPLAPQPNYLAKVIAQTKAAMGRLSEESAAIAKRVDEFRAKAEAAGTDPDAYNALVDELHAMGDEPAALVLQCKHLIWTTAKNAGIKFDREQGMYVGPEKATKKKAAKKNVPDKPAIKHVGDPSHPEAEHAADAVARELDADGHDLPF